MLVLHLAACASHSDRFPSILLLPACRKLPFTQRRDTLLESNPLGSLFSWSFLSRGPYPALDASRLSPHAVGQGRSRMWQHCLAVLLWECQLRSCTNQDVVCASSHNDSVLAVQLLRDWASPSSLLLTQPFSLLSFAFNYFLISEEKEICGRRQFQSKYPGKDSQGKKTTVGSGSFVIECTEKDDLCLFVPPLERGVSIPTGPADQPCIHL